MNFFKREELEVKFLAVEKLALLYNLFTTLLIILFYERLEHPQSMLLGRFIILAGTFSLIYLYSRYPSKATRYLRMSSQMFLLNFWYPETFEFNRMFENLDHIFASLDFALFGCQPSLLFEQLCSGLFWRELFNFGYWMYYPMITIVVTYYFFLRPRESERCSFIILFSFFIYYILFMFVPVAGPQFYFPVIGEAHALAGIYPRLETYFNLHPEISIAQEGQGALFTALVGWAQGAGERATAAFPSSHIGISTILMFLAWRMKKWLFAELFVVYILLCCATVYIKAHYLVDAIAGLATGIALYLLASLLYKKIFTNS